MRLVALLYLCALAALIVTADRGALPGPLMAIYALPWGDKAVHGLLGLCGAFLCDRALVGRRWQRLPLGSSLLSVALVLEECSHTALAHRVADPLDALATLIGVAFGAWAQSSCSCSKKRAATSVPS